jgi:5'-AMP-activated protein kinase catalytic alpha subunit
MTNIETQEKVAVKIIDKTQMQRHELHLHFNEIESLKVCCGHTNILNLLDYQEDSYQIYMVTELIEGSDLFDYIKKVNVNERMLREIMQELFMGMQYFHELGIVHRDIKLENIMIGITSTTDSQGI